jgi:ankyrin repeat protein
MRAAGTPWLLRIASVLMISWVSTNAVADDWASAIRMNEIETIRTLYPDRVEIDHPNEHGKTALMAAAAAGDLDLFEELLAAGADPSAENHLGGTVLIYAAGSGNEEIVNRLLSENVDLDSRASNGWSAVMMAAAKNEGALITLLCEAGASPNTPDIYSWTPLMRAVYENNKSAADALLAAPGIDVDLLNRNQQNALHLAVIGGHASMVEALLEHGVEQIVDANAHSPQSIARELGRDDLLRLLEKTDASEQKASSESG